MRVKNREQVISQLAETIRGMDIPARRKELVQKEDLRWLARNLGIRNSEHPKFTTAMELLKGLI